MSRRSKISAQGEHCRRHLSEGFFFSQNAGPGMKARSILLSRQTPKRIVLPQGFRFSATACGLKKKKSLDLALITIEAPASATCSLTRAQPERPAPDCWRTKKRRRRAAGAVLAQTHISV